MKGSSKSCTSRFLAILSAFLASFAQADWTGFLDCKISSHNARLHFLMYFFWSLQDEWSYWVGSLLRAVGAILLRLLQHRGFHLQGLSWQSWFKSRLHGWNSPGTLVRIYKQLRRQHPNRAEKERRCCRNRRHHICCQHWDLWYPSWWWRRCSMSRQFFWVMHINLFY